MFTPFANDTAVLAIKNSRGFVEIENGSAKITVSAEIDLTRDKEGLTAARRLADFFTGVAEHLEAADKLSPLPDVIDIPAQAGVAGPNPFD